jgi:hypothetical protein
LGVADRALLDANSERMPHRYERGRIQPVAEWSASLLPEQGRSSMAVERLGDRGSVSCWD